MKKFVSFWAVLLVLIFLLVLSECKRSKCSTSGRTGGNSDSTEENSKFKSDDSESSNKSNCSSIDYEWSEWTDDGSCSTTTCDKVQVRDCTLEHDKTSVVEDAQCQGDSKRNITCDEGQCTDNSVSGSEKTPNNAGNHNGIAETTQTITENSGINKAYSSRFGDKTLTTVKTYIRDDQTFYSKHYGTEGSKMAQTLQVGYTSDSRTQSTRVQNKHFTLANLISMSVGITRKANSKTGDVSTSSKQTDSTSSSILLRNTYPRVESGKTVPMVTNEYNSKTLPNSDEIDGTVASRDTGSNTTSMRDRLDDVTTTSNTNTLKSSLPNHSDQCDCTYAGAETSGNATSMGPPRKLTREEIEQFIEDFRVQIRKELLLDKSKLSRFKRKKKSADDNRISAKVAGYIAISIIAVVFGIILISDLPLLFQHTKMFFDNICECLRRTVR